jgi:hypothetical protein
VEKRPQIVPTRTQVPLGTSFWHQIDVIFDHFGGQKVSFLCEKGVPQPLKTPLKVPRGRLRAPYGAPFGGSILTSNRRHFDVILSQIEGGASNRPPGGVKITSHGGVKMAPPRGVKIDSGL